MFNSIVSGRRDVCAIYLATSLFGDTESDEYSSRDSLEEFYFNEKAILTINLNICFYKRNLERYTAYFYISIYFSPSLIGYILLQFALIFCFSFVGKELGYKYIR